MTTLKAPDLPTGGELLYDEAGLIYRTGRGSFQVRAKWRYLKAKTSSRSTRSPTPPPWRPSWTRWPSSSSGQDP